MRLLIVALSVCGTVICLAAPYTISQTTQPEKRPDRDVSAAALLAKAKSAVDWVHWSQTTADIDYWGQSMSPSPSFLGCAGRVTKYYAPDGRARVKADWRRSVDLHGKKIAIIVAEGYVFANGQFADYGKATVSPTNDAYVHLARTPALVKRLHDNAVSIPAYGGFLDGNIPDKDGNAVSVFELAKAGSLSTDTKFERRDGIDCDVLQIDLTHGRLRLWVAPSKGYNLVRYELTQPAGNAGSVPFSVTFEATGFMDAGGRTVIAGGRYDAVLPATASNGQIWKYTATASRTKVEINPHFTDPSLFAFTDIPDGLPVIDEDAPRVNLHYIWSKGKPVPSYDAHVVDNIRKSVQANSGVASVGNKQAPFFSGGFSVVRALLLTLVALALAGLALYYARVKRGKR